MRLDEFREKVAAEFGGSLEHVTPANVAEFVQRMEQELSQGTQPGGRIVIDEPCTTYEEVIKDFFARVLAMPPEDAVIRLWLLALDLTFAGIESHYAQQLSKLFPDPE